MPTKKEKDEAAKRSAAAKKAAATRRANAAAAENGDSNDDVTVGNEDPVTVDVEVEEETRPAVEEYKPTRLELEHEGFDQVAAEAKRQAELTAQRDEHNARTAGFKY